MNIKIKTPYLILTKLHSSNEQKKNYVAIFVAILNIHFKFKLKQLNF